MNPYGASKLEAESLLAEELRGSETDFASVRFANVYGPRQDARGEGGVVAIFLDRVARSEAPVIYGDGAQTRDFIYVGDVVGALYSAMLFEQALADAGPAYNISTGKRTSVNELVGAVRMAASYFGPVVNEPARTGDIVHSVLDPSRAARRSAGRPVSSSRRAWHSRGAGSRGIAGRVAAQSEPTPSAEEVRARFEAKARAELAAADLLVPGVRRGGVARLSGPAVAVVKGLPGPAEASGGAAVSGADGDAVAKALEKLGHDPAQTFYTLVATGGGGDG